MLLPRFAHGGGDDVREVGRERDFCFEAGAGGGGGGGMTWWSGGGAGFLVVVEEEEAEERSSGMPGWGGGGGGGPAGFEDVGLGCYTGGSVGVGDWSVVGPSRGA